METYQIIIAVLTLIYGIAFGCKNLCVTISSFFSGRKTRQSDLGRLLDATFIVAICYLFYVATTLS